MNRRQFLTGTSALAVSAALPTTVCSIVETYVNTKTGNAVLRVVFYAGRYWWITGKDNIIYFGGQSNSADLE